MGRNTSSEHQRMSPEDRRKFEGWLKANVVVGFIRDAGHGFVDDNYHSNILKRCG